MKRYFPLLIILFFSNYMFGQIVQLGNEYIGFGKFIIGESITKYNVIPAKGGKYTKDNHEFNIYAYADSVSIQEIEFNAKLMTFNDSNRLVEFVFIKFYKKNGNRKYEKEAEMDYKKLIDYLTRELNNKGESKKYKNTYNPKIIYNEQVWNFQNISIQLKKTRTDYNASFDFSIKYLGHSL